MSDVAVEFPETARAISKGRRASDRVAEVATSALKFSWPALTSLIVAATVAYGVVRWTADVTAEAAAIRDIQTRDEAKAADFDARLRSEMSERLRLLESSLGAEVTRSEKADGSLATQLGTVQEILLRRAKP
jgi:hypothetical protein